MTKESIPYIAISTSQNLQPNKFNGKELDLMHGLNTYDYGARQYDPITITWNGMDPLAEKYRQFNPTVYCIDNPVKFVDRDGREPGDSFKSPDEAAKDFGMIFNYKSIVLNREFGSIIYSYVDKGQIIYSYNEPNKGEEGNY